MPCNLRQWCMRSLSGPDLGLGFDPADTPGKNYFLT